MRLFRRKPYRVELQVGDTLVVSVPSDLSMADISRYRDGLERQFGVPVHVKRDDVKIEGTVHQRPDPLKGFISTEPVTGITPPDTIPRRQP